MRHRRGSLIARFVIIAVSLLALVAPGLAAAADSQESIVGTWLTDDGDSKVEIVRSDSKYVGKVVWLKHPERDGKPVRDRHNTDAALRDRPIMGLEILRGFSYTPNGTWTGGTVYSPRRGRSYPAEISIDKDGRLDLKVKAGFFSKHVYWTR